MPVTKDQVRLIPGHANYLGPTALLEFNIMDISFISKGMNYVVVEVTLQRRYFYHLATTYFPTLCLIVTTEMLLFINEEHFEAVIMVALTTMLVMYTLHQSISSQLPKTSYMKMIDIWLMFCLTIPFLVFVVEVICETWRYRQQQKSSKKLGSSVSNFCCSEEKNKLCRSRSMFRKRLSSNVDENGRACVNDGKSSNKLEDQPKISLTIGNDDQHDMNICTDSKVLNASNYTVYKFFISKKTFIPFLTLCFVLWYVVVAICI